MNTRKVIPILVILLVFPLFVRASLGVKDGRITDLYVNKYVVTSGDTVYLHVEINNIGDETETFWVGVTICDDANPGGWCNTNNWYGLNAETYTLGPGQWVTLTFSFTFGGTGLPTGYYDIIVGLYNQSTYGDVSKSYEYLVVENLLYYRSTQYPNYKILSSSGSYGSYSSTYNSFVYPESCRNGYFIDYVRAHGFSVVSTNAQVSLQSEFFSFGVITFAPETRGFADIVATSSMYSPDSGIWGNSLTEIATYEGLDPDYPSAYLDFDTGIYCDNTGELSVSPASISAGGVSRGTYKTYTISLSNDFMYTRDILISSTDWRVVCVKHPDTGVLYTSNFHISMSPGESKTLTVYLDPYGVYCANGLPQSEIGKSKSVSIKYTYHKGFDDVEDVEQTYISYSTYLPPSSERITPDKTSYSTTIVEGNYDTVSITLDNTLTEPTTLTFSTDRWDILCLWDSKTNSWHGSDYSIDLDAGEDVALVAELDPYGLHVHCTQTGVPSSQYDTTQSFDLEYIYYGGNLESSTHFDVTLQTCTCTEWEDDGCYNQTHRIQTRTCNPPGCDIETRYVYDPTCSPASSRIYSIEFENQTQTGVKIGAVYDGETVYVHVTLYNDGIRDYNFPIAVTICDDANPGGWCNTNNWVGTDYYYVSVSPGSFGDVSIPFTFSSSSLTPTTEPFDVIVAVYNESTKGDISKAIDYKIVSNVFYFDGNVYKLVRESSHSSGTSSSYYDFSYSVDRIDFCPNGKAFTYTHLSTMKCTSQPSSVTVSSPIYPVVSMSMTSCDDMFMGFMLNNLSFTGYNSSIPINVEVNQEDGVSSVTTSRTQIYCSPWINEQQLIPSYQEATLDNYGQVIVLAFLFNNTWTNSQTVNVSLSDYRYMCVKDNVTGTYHNSDYSVTIGAGEPVEFDVLINPWGGTVEGCTVEGLPESEIGGTKSETLKVCSPIDCSQSTMSITILPGVTHTVYWTPDYIEVEMLTTNWALGDVSNLTNGYGEPVVLTIDVSDDRWVAVKDSKNDRWRNQPYELVMNPLENVSFGVLFAMGELQMDDANLTGLPPEEWDEDHIVYVYAYNTSLGVNSSLEIYVHKYSPKGNLTINPNYLEFSMGYWEQYSYAFEVWNNDTLGHDFTINVSDNRWMVFTYGDSSEWYNESTVVYIPSESKVGVAITWIPAGGCIHNVCVEGLPHSESNMTHTTYLYVWNDSVGMYGNSTIRVSVGYWCVCTPWEPQECVGEGYRLYTRSCTPPGCDIEEIILNDSTCVGYTPSPNQTGTGGKEFIPPSLFEPLINRTLFGEAEELSIFFTPFMILTYLMVGVSGVIGYYTKSGKVFLISLSVISSILTLFGYYPIWATLIIVVISIGLIMWGRKE